jgi:hypothetical protein
MRRIEGDETYLGDGLYASFDGYQIWLRAPRAGVDHLVAIDASVWEALVEYRMKIAKASAPEIGSEILLTGDFEITQELGKLQAGAPSPVDGKR